MKLTHIVTVLTFALLAADYSHGCDEQKLLQCSQTFLESFNRVSSENIVQFICRSDVISNMRCIYEEGKRCGTINQYLASLGYASLNDVEKYCASNGRAISQNAAEQTLPTAVIIVGLLIALLVRTFPF